MFLVLSPNFSGRTGRWGPGDHSSLETNLRKCAEGLPSCTGQQPFKGAYSWNGPSENKFRGFKARFP